MKTQEDYPRKLPFLYFLKLRIHPYLWLIFIETFTPSLYFFFAA